MKHKIKIEVDGLELPLSVWVERRRDIRFSIATKSINLRVPHRIGKAELNKQIELTRQWVKNVFAEKPALKERFIIKTFQDGQILQVGMRTYTLRIELIDKKNHSGKLLGSDIFLKLSSNISVSHRHQASKKLISRIVSQDFLPEITKKVDDFNDRFFQEEINNIKIKYNHTNWGSCSSKSNLNFSSRLLFAPEEVVDYVIVHELAHLKEANHSARFWAVVEKVMPDYKQYEDWLNEFGSNLDF